MKIVDLVKKYLHIFGTDSTQDVNCQAAWLMDEGSGETIADSSQNSNTGVFKGAGEPSWETMAGINAPAYADYMLNFDGSDDYIVITDDNSLDFTSEMSYTGWYKYESGGELWGKIYYKENAYFFERSGATTAARAKVYISSGLEDTGDVTWFTLDEWVHLAVVSYRGGSNYLWMMGYANGVEIVDKNSWNAGNIDITGNDLYFGGIATATNIRGDFAEGGFFDRELDSTEVNAIMDNGLKGIVSNPYPVNRLRKDVITGYHCFLGAYVSAKREGYDPLKLPDGTIF